MICPGSYDEAAQLRNNSTGICSVCGKAVTLSSGGRLLPHNYPVTIEEAKRTVNGTDRS